MHSNRLIHEQSPYLLQHAHQPVDWYPWGEEAFARARREDRPIFLSVGYSTCHWCHVMARESFDDDAIAAVLNGHFVAVKVDREERPDVDSVYMTYVQATTGGGGWPMSVWLTPDLKPFLGGTYYPPEDRWGRPGFRGLLARIAEVWSQDRARVVAAADSALARLREAAAVSGGGGVALTRAVLDRAYDQIASSYDARYGGFGGAPKFPRPAAPDFLLRYHADSGCPEALDMVLHTLRAMAAGGMYDHLGGGFHRYAVDERWHVPHFEKMLYDQAQLACTYLDAYQITHDAFYAEVARDALEYVRRDLTGADGQVHSAEDADSGIPGDPGAHAEGAFYVWSWNDLTACLGDEVAAVVGFRYGAEPDGNVRHDPQGEFQNKNVLFVAHSLEETAARFGQSLEDLRGVLSGARVALCAQRGLRPRPHLDDKAITAWNGLMISAYARAFQALGDEAYLAAARAAAGVAREKLYDDQRGVLRRHYRVGAAAIDGYLDDYAFLIRGLLDLYEASFEASHLTWAIALQSRQDELFWDPVDRGYFSTTGADGSVLLRMKNAYDGAEPSPNSIAVMNLLRLGLMTDDPRYRDGAEQTLSAFAETLSRAPHAMPQMAAAVTWFLGQPQRVIIAGDPARADTQRLLRVVHERFLPNRVLMLADGGENQAALSQAVPAMATADRLDGQATAYVCDGRGCSLPTTAPDRLAVLLDEAPTGRIARP